MYADFHLLADQILKPVPDVLHVVDVLFRETGELEPQAKSELIYLDTDGECVRWDAAKHRLGYLSNDVVLPDRRILRIAGGREHYGVQFGL